MEEDEMTWTFDPEPPYVTVEEIEQATGLKVFIGENGVAYLVPC